MISSGDLIADRRFAYAEALAAENDHVAAAELLMQVLERTPAWAPAWLALGLAHQRSGDTTAAASAFARARMLDPEDKLGASLHRARLAGLQPRTMAPGFVAELFDQYADRFEQHLSGALAYRGPELLCDALDRVDLRGPFADVLDLGCGTGLMARAIADRTDAIDGIDVSPRMLERARATGLYRELRVAGLTSALQETAPGTYDLVLAADVFAYLGALDGVFLAAAEALRESGTLAFTVQSADCEGFALGADMRFSHGSDYVAKTLDAAGFVVLLGEAQWARREADIAVPGLVVVARKA